MNLEKNPPKSKRIASYKNAEVERHSKIVNLVPCNENQRRYIQSINSCSQVIGCGWSGTGKTYIAATLAANFYLTVPHSKIVISRPNVSVGKDLGYLPGTLEEKYAPWAMPVLDVLNEHLGKGVVETGIKNGRIEMAPLSTMRGRSFNNCFIILDEVSNTTITEICMFLTRIGKDCKVVMNGDVRQTDLKEQNGLAKMIHVAKKYCMDIPIIEFEIEDIVRSEETKAWVIALSKEGLL